MTAGSLLALLAGFAALVGGAELLVRGATRLAARLGVSPLVIGLTVVAFGTSAPEMAVSAMAAWSGQSDLAVGNAIGSNVINTLVILGLAAVVLPLTVAARVVRLEIPVMIAAALMVWLMALDGMLQFWECLVLFASILVYTFMQIRMARAERRAEVRQEFSEEFGAENLPVSPAWRDPAFALAGLMLLVLGSNWLVEGGTAIARAFGVSELVIGLTVIALGTSLPELATSVLASLRGQRDLAVGNVIGSNLFNLLAVLGIAGIGRPSGVPVSAQVLAFDLPVMVATMVICLPLFLDRKVGRGRGGLFLLCYAFYLTYLLLSATGHSKLPAYRGAMLGWVLPVLVMIIILLAVRAARASRSVDSLKS
ncbi:MAG: calcium/sodium antiporter [Planctomycetota bacterium]|nr:calcium/sodium antiporter [Planctomycetota bacterium]